MFSWTAEEHLHRLCMVFDRFWEYNLKLKLSKCSLFKEEINYLAHWVSKQGVWPSNSNLKGNCWVCTALNLYRDLCFSWPCGTLLAIHKGFCAWIAQLLNKHLVGEGASRKSEWVLLSEDTLGAFHTLKQACMSVPILAFADYTKEFLLKTNTSKEGLGAVLSQKQTDGQYHPSCLW